MTASRPGEAHPARLFREDAARASAPAEPAASGAPRRHNLPAEVASFIGRERELAEITRILSRMRLLTLTGAGGCGKTRLALRAAAGLVPNFPDGVWLVQFAPLTDSTGVRRALAVALGVHGGSGRPLLATLVSALEARRLLLVLDNCEHVIGACARLAETLLGACPRLHILATAREPLRIAGEVAWRVPSLALPQTRTPLAPESLEQVEAIALFLDRARARQPEFALTPQNAAAVAMICRRLDGLPLGIELAAAQVGALVPEQIAARLDDSLRLLGGGTRTLARHETLRSTLDWSHALLSDAERVLFRRLSVFSGGFGVEAAEGVCGGDGIERPAVLGLLTALVEKSLVEPQPGPREARYRLLEPVRQYAAALLAAQGEADALHRRHAHHFLELTEAAEPALMSGQRGPALERLTAELDNLRAALAWSRQRGAQADLDVGVRLVGALSWFWVFRGDISEGLEWTEVALAKSPDAAPDLRAKALDAAGELNWLLGQDDLARRRLEESAALWHSLGDKRGLAYVLQVLPMVITNEAQARDAAAESLKLFEEVGDVWGAAHATLAPGLIALGRGDYADATAPLEDALTRFRKLGDEWALAQTLNLLGDCARSRGDDAGATAAYEESLALLQRQGLTGSVPSLLHNLGYLALHGGNSRRALRLFRDSLTLFRNQGDQRGIAECLAGLAGVLAAMKQPEGAARLFGAAEALSEAIGAAVWPANAADYAQGVALARGQMDARAFAAAWAAGRALPLERAIAEALAPEPPDGALASGGGLQLTPREREVAALVALGLTNRQIGAALVITEGTARLHVKHVLSRLGFSSRAQVAGWAIAQGLAAAPETASDRS